MSTPYPLEEQAQQDTAEPMYNPWKGPAPPHWYSGLGFTEDTAYLGPMYRLNAAIGSGTVKGELLLGGLLHQGEAIDPQNKIAAAGLLTPEDIARAKQEQEAMNRASDAVQADAKYRLRMLTPDPQTTGVAVQTLHTLGSGISRAIVGSALGGPVGAFGTLASTEGYSAYQDLIEEGVRPGPAAAVATERGVIAGVGAVAPMAWGSSLIPRLATGMASNVGFGVAGRGIDSVILRRAGYDAMADQEQVWDRTQLFVDLALGAGFGAWAHVHSVIDPQQLSDRMRQDSSVRDAALVTNLALQDRRSGPGVPVDPASAAAHAAALEKALNDIQAGRRVNIAGTGVEDSTVLSRGGEPNPEAAELLGETLRRSGILEERAKLEQLEAVLGRRLAGEPEPTPRPPATGLSFLEAVRAEHPETGPEGETLLNGNVRAQLTADPLDERTVHIERLEALETGKGNGAAALRALTRVADREGINLTLDAHPLEEGGISPEKLRQLYERHGFQVVREEGGHAFMERPAVGETLRAAKEGYTVEEPTLEDRLAKDTTLREQLVGMKDEAGWEQKGGQLLRDAEGKVTGRTSWLPRAEWWGERPGDYNEKEVGAIVDKALAGERLGSKQRELVEYLAGIADARRFAQAYLPTDEEVRAAGAEPTVENAHEAAYVARALELPGGEARIESLAKQFENDDAGFLKAVKAFLDEHAAARAGGARGEGAAQPGAAGARPAEETAGPRSTPGAESTSGGPQPDRIVESALAERPDLTIPDGRAADVLEAANTQLADAEQLAPNIFQAAADCFSRRGGV